MAGITHLEEFQKPALRGLVDATVQDAPETLPDRFMPTVQTFDRNFAYNIVQNNSFLAAYIGYGAEPPVVDRNAVASKMGEIAYFGLKDIATYEELQAINQARNDAEQAGAIDRLTVRGVDLINGLMKLIYTAKMEALTKGTHTYNKNNVKVGFDFGVPAENKVALVPGADLDAADFDVIGMLMENVEKYENQNGQIPDVMWVSRELNAKLLRNANLITEAGRPAGSTRASQDDLNSVLEQFGLPPIQVVGNRHVQYKDMYTDAVIRREVMPANRIVMLSENAGEYLLGPTLENDFQPGLVLEAYDKQEPIQSVLRAVGAGFPTLEAASKVFHIDAYTPA